MIKVSSIFTVFYRGKNKTIVIYMLDLFGNNDPKLSNMFIFI